MSTLRALCFRISGLFDKQRKDRELADELESHLQMHIEDNLRAGMSPAEARRDALIKLGGVEQTKEKYRDRRGLPFVESVWQDVRFGVRMLRKNPGFTAVAVLTLALGIGANTAIFSVIDRMLLNLFPFPQPDRLMTIYQEYPGIPKGAISYLNFEDFQKQNRAFEAVTLWRDAIFTLTGGGNTARLNGRMVAYNYFSVLGITPIVGRTFLPEEDQQGAAPVALIGEGFWKSQFGANPKIVGASLTVNGRLYTIVGVVPSFRVLKDTWGGDKFYDAIYVPLGQWQAKILQQRASGGNTSGYGRLRAGVTIAQARVDSDRVTADLQAAYPDADKGISIAIFPLKEDTVGDIQPILWMLFAAVGFVLLIACTNIANLLLARAATREREFAVRAALGASRARMIRHYLTESLLLSWVGGILAVGLADVVVRLLPQILPSALPGATEVTLNARVLLFALALSTLSGALFALVPALKTSEPHSLETLKETSRAATKRHRAQHVLVATETALALVLLVGAGLTIRSIVRLLNVDPGFDRQGVFQFGIAAPPGPLPTAAETRARLRDLESRIRSISGVESSSFSLASFPFADNWTEVCWPADRPQPKVVSERYPMFFFAVGPDYFKTMRIPVLRGRSFTSEDDNSSPKVALVDEDLARTVFGDQDPVGKRITFGAWNETAEIVGVVDHVKMGTLDDTGFIQIRSDLYMPYTQLPDDQLPNMGRDVLMGVRSSVSFAVLVPSVQKAVATLDSNYVIHDPQTMEGLVEMSLVARRFSIYVLAVFAAIALILATIGIYGVVSYTVAERTREFGIRMALGATPSGIVRAVVGGGAALAALGISFGIASALILTRFLSSLLFGIGPYDPTTFATVAVALFAIALLACYIPARRATKVDPMVALRYE